MPTVDLTPAQIALLVAVRDFRYSDFAVDDSFMEKNPDAVRLGLLGLIDASKKNGLWISDRGYLWLKDHGITYQTTAGVSLPFAQTPSPRDVIDPRIAAQESLVDKIVLPVDDNERAMLLVKALTTLLGRPEISVENGVWHAGTGTGSTLVEALEAAAWHFVRDHADEFANALAVLRKAAT